MRKRCHLHLLAVLLSLCLASGMSPTAAANSAMQADSTTAKSSSAAATELRVAVATNFAATAAELGSAYRAETNARITFISGSTGKLYAQIRNGAPFDLFLAADQARPEALEQNGLALPGSRFTYALGRLVLWSRDPGLIDPHIGLPPPDRVRKLAIANPRLAPYGRAASEVLRATGQWAAWQPRLITGESIGQTFQFVASGNAELGFIARSQLPPNTGSHWNVPDTLHRPIKQQAVILTDSPAARGFADWLRSSRASAIIAESGYTVPEQDDAARR